MEIKLITSNKKQFLDLLLLADEQESMIDKYLERGEMFALYDDGLKAISVVTCEGEGIYEIKNIAVCPSSQRKDTENGWLIISLDTIRADVPSCLSVREIRHLHSLSTNIAAFVSHTD